MVSQSARQEEHISDLEADLEAAMLQLKEKEKELEHWKKHVCQLTELSISSPTSGTLPTLLSADCFCLVGLCVGCILVKRIPLFPALGLCLYQWSQQRLQCADVWIYTS